MNKIHNIIKEANKINANVQFLDSRFYNDFYKDYFEMLSRISNEPIPKYPIGILFSGRLGENLFIIVDINKLDAYEQIKDFIKQSPTL